jgi:LEA14-like dessication related protein
MKNFSGIRMWTVLTVVIIFFFSSCSKPEAPEYLGFRDFSIQNISMDSALLHTQLSFYNPNPYNMELKRGDVNVFLDDKLANHYVLDSTIVIPKKDTFYVPLDLRVSPKLLIGSAISMLLNNNKIKVRLVGSIRVKKGAVGFTVPVNYEVMQSLQ